MPIPAPVRGRTPGAVALLALALAAAPAHAQQSARPAAGGVGAEGSFAPAALRRDLSAFAADSFRGREAGTPDADRAAAWLARHLAAAGVEPAGDSGYFQPVPLTVERVRVDSPIALATPGAAPVVLRHGPDVFALPSLGPAPTPLPRLEAEGEVVFLGHAAARPAAVPDLRGKVVVYVNDAPPGADAATRQRLSGINGLSERGGWLVSAGAAAVVALVPDTLYDFLRGQLASPVTPGGATAAPPPRALPMVLFAPLRDGRSPFVPAGWTPATPDGAFAAPGAPPRFSAALRQERRSLVSYNVVGRLRGSDAARAGRYVAYGAHYDHAGILPAAERGGVRDSIANGADDDASGTVALLAIARAWAAAPRPAHSALFVFHTAEEKNLLGSAHFVAHPTVPLDSIVALVNADMIGRNAADSLHVIGPSSAPDGRSAALGPVLDAANAALARPFVLDRSHDAPDHPERLIVKSDQWNYAARGVPVLFLWSGYHADYHQVSDEADRVNYDKLARVATLMYEVGRRLATPR